MDNEQIDFNSYNWQLQRDDRYTCKHCKKFLTFYQDNYICNHCGVIYKHIAILGCPYQPPKWQYAVRFIKTTIVVEDAPESETNEKQEKLSTEEKINRYFTEKILDKQLQNQLWLTIGKISVSDYLKKNGYKYKYIKSDKVWSDLYIYRKVAA